MAKTGTMGAVSGLSGYLKSEDEKLGTVRFSLLGNSGEGAGGQLRQYQDRIAVLLALTRNC